MVKGKVTINKSNGVKLVYLPKNSPFKEGAEVEIDFKGFGIYGKENLEKYYEDNKEFFIELRDNISKIRKKIWKGEEYQQLQQLGELVGLGSIEGGYDEPIMWENCNEYGMEPFGDIDGGIAGDYIYEISTIFEAIENKEFNLDDDNVLKKDFKDYCYTLYLQKFYERLIDKENIHIDKLLKDLGFKELKIENCGIYFEYESDPQGVWYNGMVYVIRSIEGGYDVYDSWGKHNIYF